MKTITRTILPTLACVLALAATTATAAQAATEGPFYKITGTRLATGATKEITTKNTDNYILHDALGPDITCTSQKFASGAEILGSTGANSSSGEATLEFTGCSLSGNGVGCSIESVKTKPLKTALVYLGTERTGKLGIDFTPVTKHTFAELKFTGSGCKLTSLKVEGSIAVTLYSGEKAVEVGKEPAEAATLGLKFHAYPENPEKVWSEASGALVLAEPFLEGDGPEFQIVGASSLELAGGASWGVFT